MGKRNNKMQKMKVRRIRITKFIKKMTENQDQKWSARNKEAIWNCKKKKEN